MRTPSIASGRSVQFLSTTSGRLRTVLSSCTPTESGHDQAGVMGQAEEGAVIDRGMTWSRFSAGVRACRVAASRVRGCRPQPRGCTAGDSLKPLMMAATSIMNRKFLEVAAEAGPGRGERRPWLTAGQYER
jgi:hypothetical protein